MSAAREEFLATLKSIRDALDKIINNKSTTSVDALLIGGLNISTFVAMEVFLRNRVIETISTLTESISFSKLPIDLQSYILQESLSGINNCILSKKDGTKLEKVQKIQYEGVIISISSEPSGYTPSEYTFGRSKSNISKSSILDLLTAFNVNNPSQIANELKEKIGFISTTNAFDTFELISQKRHKCAHTINHDFLPKDLMDEVIFTIPLACFIIDAILTHAALAIKNEVQNPRQSNKQRPKIQAERINIRKFICDSNGTWQEHRNDRVITDQLRVSIGARLSQYFSSKNAQIESWIKIDCTRAINEWGQPNI